MRHPLAGAERALPRCVLLSLLEQVRRSVGVDDRNTREARATQPLTNISGYMHRQSHRISTHSSHKGAPMKRILLGLVAAASLAGTALSPASAQGVPNGSYQQSCTNIRVRGDQLVRSE